MPQNSDFPLQNHDRLPGWIIVDMATDWLVIYPGDSGR
jgi:hypothetical protein